MRAPTTSRELTDMASDPNDPRNRRRWPRLAVSVKVSGRWRARTGAEQDLEALLLWVSAGGAQLRCSAPVPANATVRFTLRLGRFQRFEPTGRVRWWRRIGEVRDLGVEFAEPIPRIGEYVRKQLEAREVSKGRFER